MKPLLYTQNLLPEIICYLKIHFDELLIYIININMLLLIVTRYLSFEKNQNFAIHFSLILCSNTIRNN